MRHLLASISTLSVRLMLLALLVLGLRPAPAIGQATYYLSPDGADSQAGTRGAPWATLEKAAEMARAGDTVILLPGTYEGALEPAHSGTAEAPITFRAAERRSAKLVGCGREGYAVFIDGKSYIRIEGLRIQPRSQQSGRWMKILNSDHIKITNVLMEETASQGGLDTVPFVIQGSEHVQLRQSILRERIGGDMMHIFNSKYILFEGNAISRAGHSPMAFSPRIRLFKQTQNIVMRGNVFHAGWRRPFEFLANPRFCSKTTSLHTPITARFQPGLRPKSCWKTASFALTASSATGEVL